MALGLDWGCVAPSTLCWLRTSLLPDVRNQHLASRSAAPMTSDVIIVVIAPIATAFTITLAVVIIEMWPWFRKRPDVAKENDDERRQA
jgi:hypothetical protein